MNIAKEIAFWLVMVVGSSWFLIQLLDLLDTLLTKILKAYRLYSAFIDFLIERNQRKGETK